MKKLIVCCDGTWNRLDAINPTNVVKFAQSVASEDQKGISQIVFYDEGVGTGDAVARNLEKLWGGAFGEGLLRNVEDAYRFLIFNYKPGDEIHVVGFSRGAFQARSLVGLVRNCGILARKDAGKVSQAMNLYRSREEEDKPDSDKACKFRSLLSSSIYLSDYELNWRKQNIPDFDEAACQRLKFSYLGIWDTVGARGIPNHWAAAGLFNKKYNFHDQKLSSCVLSARHAVAIDERRKIFAPTLWDNLSELNEAFGPDADGARRYLQVWFPGDHGSVGGGGDITGLSDAALRWIVEGARKAGIAFNTDEDAAVNQIDPDHCAALKNISEKSGFNLLSIGFKADRSGPQKSDNVSSSTWKRWCEAPEKLPEKTEYRPGALDDVAQNLESFCLTD